MPWFTSGNKLAGSFRIAAIDAGSNGIRMAVAEARSSSEIEIVDSVRESVRLGHRVFTVRRLSRLTIKEAARAFRRFRRLLDGYQIQQYRAVATSAAREAKNRDALLRRIRRDSGITLEVIGSAEESRLVRLAILKAVGEKVSPRWIVDLGGGSLEISLLRKRKLEEAMALPLGTVRLMEMLRIGGAFTEEQCERVEHRILSHLQSICPNVPSVSGGVAAGSGGNAEAFARIFPGPALNGIPSINLRLLRERLWSILSLDIDERMEEFRVRRDRAEVLGVAAIVFSALSRHLKLRTMLVPGVGVKEGILWDLGTAHFAAISPEAYAARFRPLLREVRRVALRFHCDVTHAEHVRKLAAELFDEIAPARRLPNHLRLPLEIAAMLHEIGCVIGVRSSHKHGEYIMRHTEIAGLTETDRRMAACLIRYQSDVDPDVSHKLYASLSTRQRHQVCGLAGILRIAIALNGEGQPLLKDVRVEVRRKQVRIRANPANGSPLRLRILRRAARLFEQEFGCRVSFGRLRVRQRRNGSLSRSQRAA